MKRLVMQFGVFFAILLTCATLGNAFAFDDRTKLSQSEVRSTFVNKHWHSRSWTFFFSNNGTYTVVGRKKPETHGPWKYRIASDGTLKGNTTHYTFYRNKDGTFSYYHSRNRKFYRAYLGK